MAHALIKEISDDFLTCQICLDTFRKPKILDCVHSFCEDCLKEYVKPGETTVKCPTCQRETALKQNGVSGLKDNFFILNLVETIGARKKVQHSVDKIPCDSCAGTEAVVSRCLTCNDFLCESCVAIHRTLRAFKGHLVVTLDELRTGKYDGEADKTEPTCDIHAGEKMRFYCKTDGIPVCRDCTVLDHPKPEHDVVNLTDVAEVLGASCQSMITELQQALDSTENDIKAVDRSIVDIQTNDRKMEELVDERVSHLVTLIKTLGEQCKEKVEATCRQDVKQLYGEKERLELKKVRLASTQELTQTLLSRGTDIEVASAFRQISQCRDELCTATGPERTAEQVLHATTEKGEGCDVLQGREEWKTLLAISDMVTRPTVSLPNAAPRPHLHKGQLQHIDDGLDGGQVHDSHHKEVNRASQTTLDDPIKIVMDPDIMSYMKQVNGLEVLDIILKNKSLIVINYVNGQTEVEFFGSDAAGSDPNNALEDFTTLYQKIHHGIVCKTLKLRSKHIPPDDVSKAVAKITEDLPRVMLKTTADKDVMFYGTDREVQEAKTAMCEHLGIAERGRRRRGMDGAAGMPGASSRGGTGTVRFTEWFNHTTKEGIQIVVAHGDITQQSVDVIANNANEHLSHGSGVAGAISRAGGPSVQQESSYHVKTYGRVRVTETAVTGGGQLPCKNIIHAVGPRWTHGREDANVRELQQTCYNILNEASATLKAQSVAIPAISSGIFGMPKQKCAESLLSGLVQFLQRANSPSCTLRRIIFIDMDQATVKVLADTFQLSTSALTSTTDSVSQPPPDQFSQTESRKSHTDQGDKGSTSGGDDATGDCPMCMSGITDPKSLPCKHTFCRVCIDTALSYKSQCPMCNTIVGELKGNQPQGRMNWYTTKGTRLAGYENCGAIVINYHFSSGTQGSDHPNPGRRYSGTSWCAYLPDNEEGRELVQLLKRAFDNRLVFTIGTSVTTGATDTVVWNDIHHKINVSGGASSYGYPDPGYLARLREELAAKGIK
ncbi:uncharacterized protein LOC118414188 isoform X1 [Branchiostoma floridae]|uniref:RING-type E3 ubiquitin transferase n=3 Tax=Branchiostoma floridae TaxID=7739 RepID=A0A9J7L0K9_BRAFL|nr:uncharacterized protein LOC118414188 isoform X1 [Branchiostoma floridae]